MAANEGVVGAGAQDRHQPEQQSQQQPPKAAERLNPAVQQQLNLASVKTRAISLFKAISRILEDFDAFARTNTVPKWQDVLGQYSMVNLELFNIVEDIKKVSKAFVVHPKNVNAENSTILPVMLSTKLLPEMEMDDNSKREQMLHGMQNLPISAQIEKLKTRIDMIGEACEGAEKILAETRKAYSLGNRQGSTIAPMDKVQAAKIQEQENLLRAAVNTGEGLRIPADQRQITPALPIHLVDVLTVGDGVQTFPDGSGLYSKSTPLSSSHINNQGTFLQVANQASAAQVIGRSVASPSSGTVATPFDSATASPLPYANSPRSGANMMNAPSPQQQAQQQQQQLQQQQQQQQQRQKMIQLPQHQQQLLAQQQFRQGLGQNQLPQLHDLQGHAQQKFQSLHGQHQMQFSQPLGHQQFQSRQISSGHVQHNIGQTQLNQGNQLNRHLSQFSGGANNALFNAAQTTPNTQMYGISGANPQRSHASQILTDQMFNMGATNSSSMMNMQQQQPQPQPQLQHGSQGAFGNLQQNAQNLGMVSLQSSSQNHPNFQPQRQQNQ